MARKKFKRLIIISVVSLPWTAQQETSFHLEFMHPSLSIMTCSNKHFLFVLNLWWRYWMRNVESLIFESKHKVLFSITFFSITCSKIHNISSYYVWKWRFTKVACNKIFHSEHPNISSEVSFLNEFPGTAYLSRNLTHQRVRRRVLF